MAASDDNDELAYVSEVRFGRFAALVLAMLVTLSCLWATGAYHQNRADKLWPLVSRKRLPQDSQALDDSTTITLNRSMCFGWCPEYTVRIFGSGRIEYVGIHYVCTFGAHEAMADAREVRRLVEAMIAVGYFDYEWKEGPFSTDAPTVTSLLEHKGRSYALRHYRGDQGAPRWLDAMEKEIDRVAGTARWLPRSGPETDWRALCPTPEGGERDVTIYEPIEGSLQLILPPVIPPAPPIAEPPPPYELRL